MIILLLSVCSANLSVKGQGRTKPAIDRAQLQALMSSQADPELFRRELSVYLNELMEVALLYQEIDRSTRVLSQAGFDLVGQVAEAQRRLPEMTTEEIVAMRAGYARHPYWRELPAALGSFINQETKQKIASRLSARDNVSGALIADSCTDATNANISLTDVSIAKGVELAANAVMEGFPTDGFTILGRLAPIAAWAVAAGVALSLEQLNSILDNCQTGEHQTKVETNLDVMVSTRADQTTANQIKTHVTTNLDVKSSTLSTQVSVNQVQTGVTELIAKGNQLQGTANTTLAEVNAIRQKVDTNLDEKVSTRASQQSVNTLQSTANTINTKVDQALLKLDALAAQVTKFQAENLQLQIELNLQLGPRYHQVLFQLPQSQGGYLEEVRRIVNESIAKCKAAGQMNPGSIEQAENYLRAGDAYRTAGNYKEAFTSYRTAYLLISAVASTRQP